MENKLIISLLLVIIALLVILGMLLINPLDARTDTKIIVTSNDTLFDGDYFSISLTDINGTPIANQTVNITIIDANGGKNPQQVITDGMGNGMLQLNGLAIGNYTINVTYGGNANYSSCNVTQKLTMDEIHVTYDYPYHSDSIGDFRKTGIGQDECAVVVTPSGKYYVMAGDGIYEYGGLDSNGNIIVGDFVGK
jgi:hypothetical protein